MIYNISINQTRSVEWGLSLAESCVFQFLFGVASWATHIEIDGKIFYHASRHKAIEELPLVTDKPDTMYRHYKSIESKGLIIYRKVGLLDCICLTEKGKKWLFTNSEKNPSLGKKSELLGKKSELTSEKNPTYNNTILNHSTNNDYEEKTTPTISPDDIQDFENQINGNSYPPNLPDGGNGANGGKEKSSAKKEKDSAEKWGGELLDDQMFVERTCMNYRISPQQLQSKWDAFVLQKRAIGELDHRNISDLRKNFFFWIPKSMNHKQYDNARKNNKPFEAVTDETLVNVFDQLQAKGYF